MPLFAHSQRQVESRGGLDQAEVTEGLRKDAEQSPRAGFEFFRQQANLVRGLGVTVEHLQRFLDPPDQGQRFGEPETAECKRPLARTDTIALR